MNRSPSAGRPRATVPSYRLHRSSGNAVVTVDRRDFYLGPFGSDESRRKYGEIISQLAGGNRLNLLQATPAVSDDVGPSVAELCLAYLDFAESWYVKNGQQTDEVDCYRSLIRVFRELYGLKPLREFGPNDLRAVQAKMVELKWSRGFINRQIVRLRHMFKWAVGREMAGDDVLNRLKCVESLLAGRSKAKEGRKRGPVTPEQIEAVKGVLRSQKVKDLIDLQLATGTRPGELLMLTTGMIDRSGSIWTARLEHHKTEHRGKVRVLAFGPKAQVVLENYLQESEPDQLLFCIRRNTYSNIVRAACKRANVSPFAPHELRHTSATLIRDRFGSDAAQAVLGHSKPDMTAHYTSQTIALAVATAEKMG